MQVPGEPLGLDGSVSRRVNGDLLRVHLVSGVIVLQFCPPGKIQANFEAQGVKTFRPIDFVPSGEVMPFDADAPLGKTSMNLPPDAIDAFPGGSLD